MNFITYGDLKYNKSKERICKEASAFNIFDSIKAYGPEDLTDAFKNEFSHVLSQPRGGGYWIWKFDIIEQELEKMNDGEYLVYADSGCTLNIRGKPRFLEYIQMLKESDKGIISFATGYNETMFTTKEILEYFDADEDIKNSGQYIATVLIMKKCDHLRLLLEKIKEALRDDPKLFTDFYNKAQNPGFNDNRHDQSILSVARKVHGSIVIPDETWFAPFGNQESLKCPIWATRIRC